MEELFLKLVNMSITASWLVLAVMLFRIVLKKAPKYIRCILWGLVGLRLICPFSIESVLSLIPSSEPLPEEFLYAATPQIHTGISAVNNALNPVIAESLAPVEPTSANPTQIWSFILSHVWLIGMIAMALYALVSYLLLRRRVKVSIRIGSDLHLCDHIDTPFILGIVKPRIYLPSNLDQKTADHVLAHEYAHLKRRDHWWKPLGFAILSIYWFNPLMWAAYILLCRDIELACDEKVIQNLDADHKKAYSQALLSCSVPRRMIAACPLAFGEVGVKSRIKSVLNYKKPAFWIIVAAVIASIAVAVCFMTDPKDDDHDVELIDSITTIENIIREKGYTILNQAAKDIEISIPKSALPDSIYSEEGQTFAVNDIIVYQTDTTMFYLDSVRFSNEGEDLLYFKFDAIYTPPEAGTVTLLYEALGNGKTSHSLWVNNTTVTDDTTEYPDAVSIRGMDGRTSFTVYVDTEVCKAASGFLSFTVDHFTDLTYVKKGLEETVNDLPWADGTFYIDKLLGQHIALSFRPEKGEGQITLSGDELTVTDGEGSILFTGSDPTVTSSTWSLVRNHLEQDEPLLLQMSILPQENDGGTPVDILEYFRDGELLYTIYCIQGSPSMIYSSGSRLFALVPATDAVSDRLAVGSYVPVECLYMNLLSSYSAAKLSEEYIYTVTEEGFYTDSFAFICNTNVDRVDWGWKTLKEAGSDLEFFYAWLESDFSVPMTLEEDALYQKLDSRNHLLLQNGDLLMIHGGEAKNEMELVWGIYKLVPRDNASDILTGEVSSNQGTASFSLYFTDNGTIYDMQTPLDAAIRDAIFQNNQENVGSTAVQLESHLIFSQMVGCGRAPEDAVEPAPCGITTVHVLSLITECRQNENGIEEISSKLIPAELSFDEYTDGSFVLTQYLQPEENEDPDSFIHKQFPDHAVESFTKAEDFRQALTRSCWEQAAKYFQLNTDSTIEALLTEICADPKSSSNHFDYVEAHLTEFNALVNYGEFTLRYCFERFLEGGETGLKGQIMSLACQRIMEIEGLEVMQSTLTGQEWFDEFRADAEKLPEENNLLTLEEEYPSSLLLLKMTYGEKELYSMLGVDDVEANS